jgi:hypothetical protein
MMRTYWLTLLTFVIGSADAPFPVRAAGPESGTAAIIGAVDQPKRVTAVVAVDRGTDKKYPGKIDTATGRFTIPGLPVGGVYDCIIDFDGARLEGVSLKVKASDYEEEQPLTKDDVESIKKTTLSLNKFEDKVEVLAVEGNIQHAAVVVHKLRLKPFINSQPGEIVWRLELWHFEKPDETWIKGQDDLFLVLYRERLQKSAFEKKSLMLDSALGGIAVTEKNATAILGTIKLPSKEPGVRLRNAKNPSGKG